MIRDMGKGTHFSKLTGDRDLLLGKTLSNCLLILSPQLVTGLNAEA